MATLEQYLRERLSDHRAMTGTLNINAERVYIDFGDIGLIEKVRLLVKGSEVSVVHPRVDHADDAPPVPLPEPEPEPAPLPVSPPAQPEPVPEPEPVPPDAVPPAPVPTDEDASRDDAPPAPSAHIDPNTMTKAALIELGRATSGAVFKDSDSKAEIAAAIKAAILAAPAQE